MNYLLINTANDELVIVLVKNGAIFACNERNVKKHNEILLPKLDELLKQAGVTLNDIDEFGVVVGPGSFTGIRVGIATVKAFKDVTGKSVRAINNLDLLYQIAKDKYSIVAIEGSLNSYFVAKFENEKLNIYERNLTSDELVALCNNQRVAMFANSHNFELGDVVEFDNNAFVDAFVNAQTYDITPVYYQLSQAENDKIDRANIVIREAEVYDIKDILNLTKTSFDYSIDLLEQKLLNKNYITYVAQIDEQITGFIVVDRTSLIEAVKVDLVVVDTNFRNHGIGSKLIERVELIARDNKSQVILEADNKYFTIKTLCQKLGYKVLDNTIKHVLIKKFN